ncbi:MAG: ATP-dependent Clp protease ATP-binding subunit [Acidobacteria bacterium]|nr:MAG: ATP-dependent Clp protease ATP-binding subunit [Acidobacteriota bacterium]
MGGRVTILDPSQHSPEVREFENALLERLVGQDRAVRRMARVYQVYLAGLSTPSRPLVNLLFLGPTGSGKTRMVEAAAEVFFGQARAVVKIDCAEFQHSHEIAKLIGSPPGYLGHRETQPLITQDVLDEHQTEKLRLSLVLFDEIEKASDALWQLLLGILDKGTLTLGDNRRVDFSRTMIFMTSNLGSHEVANLMTGGIGFSSTEPEVDEEFERRVYRMATEAARRKFSPEFLNRIDKVIVFRALQRPELEKILDIELGRVQERIIASTGGNQFVFKCTAEARNFLLREGTDMKYGARHLKRAIERHLVFPLSNLIATRQIQLGDLITVDFDSRSEKLVFMKEEQGALVGGLDPTAAAETELVPASSRRAGAASRALARRATRP